MVTKRVLIIIRGMCEEGIKNGGGGRERHCGNRKVFGHHSNMVIEFSRHPMAQTKFNRHPMAQIKFNCHQMTTIYFSYCKWIC